MIGLGVHVDRPHVHHVVRPLLSQVPHEQVPLMIGVHLCTCTFDGYFSTVLLILPAPPGATWSDKGVVLHVSWRQGIADPVCNPVIELVTSRRDEAALKIILLVNYLCTKFWNKNSY